MELVDIVDENNKLTGQVEDRWVAYNKGLWRRTGSCWIMNEKGEVFCKREHPTRKEIQTSGQKLEDKLTVEKLLKKLYLEK